MANKSLENFIDLMIAGVERCVELEEKNKTIIYPLQYIVDIIEEKYGNYSSEVMLLLNQLLSNCDRIYPNPLNCTIPDHYGNFGHSKYNDFWRGWDPYTLQYEHDDNHSIIFKENGSNIPKTLLEVLCNAENGLQMLYECFLITRH